MAKRRRARRARRPVMEPWETRKRLPITRGPSNPKRRHRAPAAYSSPVGGRPALAAANDKRRNVSLSARLMSRRGAYGSKFRAPGKPRRTIKRVRMRRDARGRFR